MRAPLRRSPAQLVLGVTWSSSQLSPPDAQGLALFFKISVLSAREVMVG